MVERSDFVEEFVCILLNKKDFAFQLKEVILLKNLFCILLNKKGFAEQKGFCILVKRNDFVEELGLHFVE